MTVTIANSLRALAMLAPVAAFASGQAHGGQTYDLKDHHGIVVARVSDVRLFRYSTYFKKNIADFECEVMNVSGEPLPPFSLKVTVRKADGGTADFEVFIGYCEECFMRKDATFRATREFVSLPYTEENLKAVEFALDDKWQSPEDRRISAKARAREDAAEAARRKRLDAQLAKAEAEQRRRLRASCAAVYESTAEKKVGDLTVREEQQARACQALGMYPPR